MAKQTSLFGKISGKLGAVVFSTSGGETISREYNPHVSNPSTDAQVNQRARMKLMSQLSAALSPVIAMTKDGLISKRNKFVKRNFENSYAANGIAQVSYENVQLTEGNSGLPQIVASFNAAVSGNPGVVGLGEAPSATIKRVVYCLFEKSDEGRLTFLASQISTKPDGILYEDTVIYFPSVFTEIQSQQGTGGLEFAKEYVVYAYGMSDTSEAASAKYGNLNVESASDLANLVGSRTLTFEDYQFTQTRGATLQRGGSAIDPTPTGQARVFVTALGNGTVSGGGTFALGTNVTVTATPSEGATFRGWKINGYNAFISTSNPYTFELNGQRDLVAVFDGGGNESL